MVEFDWYDNESLRGDWVLRFSSEDRQEVAELLHIPLEDLERAIKDRMADVFGWVEVSSDGVYLLNLFNSANGPFMISRARGSVENNKGASAATLQRKLFAYGRWLDGR